MTFMNSYCANIVITLAEEWQSQILDTTFTEYCIVTGNMLQQGKLQKRKKNVRNLPLEIYWACLLLSEMIIRIGSVGVALKRITKYF